MRPALHRATRVGFECVDANLIYAIPGQQVEDTAEDARRCIAAGVDQISAYPLLTFPHTPLGRRAAAGSFDGYGQRARLRAQRLLSRTCRRAGLQRTSVWSFNRPGTAPYSTVAHEDYVGSGAGAGSKVGGIFWFNTFSIPAYCAHQPSGSFTANAAWTVLAAITHNLLRAAGTVTDVARYAVARGATLRTHLINVAARFARPQRRPILHLPSHWPRADVWLALWRAVFNT